MASPNKPAKRKSEDLIGRERAAGGRLTRKTTPDNAQSSVRTKSSTAAKARAGRVGDELPDDPSFGNSRYTPKVAFKIDEPRSSVWIAIGFFGFLALGALTIAVNYIPFGLPGTPSTWYLFAGLGFITVGFMFGTQLK